MSFDRTKPVNGTTVDADMLGGQLDGAGTPTIADGAIYRYDASAGALKPWNVTIQTIEYMDHSGNPQTKQVICPP